MKTKIVTRAGRDYLVTFRDNGQFAKGSWKPVVKKPPPPPPPPPPKKRNYKYDIIVRVAYKAKKIGHGRMGEISGTIITATSLEDEELIFKCIGRLKGRDYWLDYIDPNKIITVHISESRTLRDTEFSIRFNDLGGYI